MWLERRGESNPLCVLSCRLPLYNEKNKMDVRFNAAL